jgi:hypothetical protein
MRKRKNGQDEIIQDLIRQLGEQPDIHVAKRLVRALERAGRGEKVLDEPLSLDELKAIEESGERVGERFPLVSGVVHARLDDLVVGLDEGDEEQFLDVLSQKLVGGHTLADTEWRIVDLGATGADLLIELKGSFSLEDADEDSSEDEDPVEGEDDEPELCAGCGGVLLSDDGGQDDDYCFRCRARRGIGPTTGVCAVCEQPVVVDATVEGVLAWFHGTEGTVPVYGPHEARPAGGPDHEDDEAESECDDYCAEHARPCDGNCDHVEHLNQCLSTRRRRAITSLRSP